MIIRMRTGGLLVDAAGINGQRGRDAALGGIGTTGGNGGAAPDWRSSLHRWRVDAASDEQPLQRPHDLPECCRASPAAPRRQVWCSGELHAVARAESLTWALGGFGKRATSPQPDAAISYDTNCWRIRDSEADRRLRIHLQQNPA